ncbi:MAG TPA: hypothetical protein VFL03_09625 [Candidatus Limnocylindrales bacterium]|jgi:hypothetical protein|nr:hypothetical protein [Candidatus Limnocylindrales bacterium]
MRSLVRAVAPVAAALLIALVGASSTMAASPTNYRVAFDEAWCNGDSDYMTCFEQRGQFHVVDNGNTSSVLITQRVHAVHYEQGVQVAEDTEVSSIRFAERADGTYVTHEVVNTRVRDGEFKCSFGSVFTIVDFEVSVDHEHASCA